MPLSAFEQRIKQLADEDARSFNQLAEADQTALAVSYFAEDYARTDVAEILASDPEVDEMFAKAKAQQHDELGVLFVRAMHVATEQAINDALEREHRRRREEREAAEEDQRGYFMERLG